MNIARGSSSTVNSILFFCLSNFTAKPADMSIQMAYKSHNNGVDQDTDAKIRWSVYVRELITLEYRIKESFGHCLHQIRSVFGSLGM